MRSVPAVDLLWSLCSATELEGKVAFTLWGLHLHHLLAMQNRVCCWSVRAGQLRAGSK
jgi:hypothetical protein